MASSWPRCSSSDRVAFSTCAATSLAGDAQGVGDLADHRTEEAEILAALDVDFVLVVRVHQRLQLADHRLNGLRDVLVEQLPDPHHQNDKRHGGAAAK